MRKLLGGLALGLVVGSMQHALAQDPFGFPNEEPAPVQTGPSFSEFPAPQTEPEPEAPIIQTAPMAKAERPYNEAPLKSRTQNAYVRAHRTPAQEYIHKRAQHEAQQRTLRMEQRKWRGESLLRPDNEVDHSWWYAYEMPVWLATQQK
jgi:hypothetical protein